MDVPDPIDLAVGARLRILRRAHGLSQTELAGRVDLTFQQIQKYERGANRISASKLWRMAKVLDVPVSRFFGDTEQDTSEEDLGYLAHADAPKLLLAWSRIPTVEQRRAVLKLMESFDVDPAAEEADRG